MSNIIKTTFYGLTIVHPHSGKVSRSVIERLIRHYANGYLGQTSAQNAEYLIKNGDNYIVLKDINGKICIDYATLN